MATFEQKLAIMRMVRGLTQMELSQRTGIPRPTISFIENGLVQPTGEQVAAFREVLDWPERADVAFAILFGDQDEAAEAAS